MSNFNVQNDKWLEIAFKDRNQAYGAYQLRKESNATTIKAMLVTFGAVAIAIGLFSFAKPEIKPVKKNEKPKEVIEKIRLVRIFTPTEPKTFIKRGAEKTKLNNTKNKVAPIVVDRKEVKPIVLPKNPDDTTPFNSNGIANGKPGIEGNPNGTITNLNPINVGGGTSTKPNIGPYKGVLGVEASFPGGINKFRTFIAENYKIPYAFNQNELSIELVFIIELDGSMTDIRMISKGDKALETEAIRVLKAMKKKWTPGRVNGEIVRSEKRLPIKIQFFESNE